MNNDFYQSILHESPVGYAYHRIILDEEGSPCDYEYMDVNKAFESFTGLKTSDIIGKKITEILPEIKADEFNWIKFYGEIAIQGGNKEFEQFSESLKRWYRVNVYSPEKYHFITYFIDITKEMSQLFELNNFFKVNLDLLCINDMDGNFIKVNKEWELILGYSMEELKSKQYLDFVHPDDMKVTLEEISKISKQGRILNFVNRYRCKDGTYRYLEWNSNLQDHLIYTAARDITERKQTEQHIQNQAISGKLLAKISTDFLSASHKNMDEKINNMLRSIGTFFGLDRGYLFEFSRNGTITSTHEWCAEGISARMNTSVSAFVNDFPWCASQIRINRIINIPNIHIMPTEAAAEKEIFIQLKIKSFLGIPVLSNGKLIAMLGFDSVTSQAALTQEQLALFTVIANTLADALARHKLEKRLTEEAEFRRMTLLSIGDGVISTNGKGEVITVNKVAEQLTGWTLEEALCKNFDEVFQIVDEYTKERREHPIYKVLETGEAMEFSDYSILISKDGIERPIENSAAPIKDKDGNINGVVLVFRDFSEKKEKQLKIENLSFRDQLTGLYNRRFFEEELRRLDTERNLPITVIMGDVNGLKLANDAFGHFVGDQLLIKAAEAIESECRKGDVIARIGGDEFVVILPHTDTQQANRIVERIKDRCAKEEINSVVLSISFGCDTKRRGTDDIKEILKRAEVNMYRHKLLESPHMRDKTVKIIKETLFEKYENEKEHSEGVGQLSESLGIALNLNQEDINMLKRVGLMHDIGKIAIEERILHKPKNLNHSEWIEVKRHSETGYRILGSVTELSQLANYVLAHHERWDGKGYPKGLKGDEIPFEARVICITDAFNAMMNDRPYRKALSRDAAIEEIRINAGTQFDPHLARVFVEKVLGERWS